MEKGKLKLFKNRLISLRKQCKIIPLFSKENNIVQGNISLKNKSKNKDKNTEKNENNFSKIINYSNPFIRRKLLMINNKIDNNKKINININKKINTKRHTINLDIKNYVKKIKKLNYTKIIKKGSYNKIHSSINKTYSNRPISRNIKNNKNIGNIFKNSNYSLNTLSTNLKKNNENNKNINKNDNSLNYLYEKFKIKYCNKVNKKKYININPVVPIKKINAINSFIYDLNSSNKNINKISININDFKKFNGELVKRKLKTYKTNNNLKNFQNNTLLKIYPSFQSSIRIPKKESYISNKTETNSLEFKKIKNKSKETKRKTIIKRKDKKLIILNNSKTFNSSSNKLRNIINRSYSINHLYNNKYQIGRYNLNIFSNINNNKKQKLFPNKKRNTNFNLTDINYKTNNNTSKGSKNTNNKSIKKFHHEIINIRIDNTVNNIVNINSNLTNLNNKKYSTLNTNKNNIINNDKNNIYKNKERDLIKNKKNKRYLKNKNILSSIRTIENKPKDKNKKNQSLSFRKKKIKNEENNSNHNLLYINLIIKNNIKKLQNKKYNSRNKTRDQNKNNNIILNENIKKIREERKKKSSLSMKSINTIKISSNIKLKGLKTIFYNIYNIDKKQFLSFNTPKAKTPCSVNSLNYLNISRRYNRTEEKINYFYKNIKKIEENDKKNKYYNKIKKNPQYSIEYIDEILQNLLIEENDNFEEINFGIFNKNNNFKYCIKPESWLFFINSLINIQEILYFDEQTLFSTIQIFDKYISEILYKETNKKINEENLDIVIVTSLIIASKRQEIKLYPMKDYLNLLPDKYTLKDLMKQENDILYKFNFNIFKPNSLDFFEIFSIICKLDNVQKYKGLYLLNIILLDCHLLKIPSSLIAFSVIKMICKYNIKKYLVNKIIKKYKKGKNNKEIKMLKIINKNEIINSINEYIQYIERNIKLTNYDSVIKKFNTIKYYYAPSYTNI